MRANLVQSLDAMPEATKDSRIFLRADRSVPYGELMDVLELLRVGGYLRIALVALEDIPGTIRSPSTPANSNPEGQTSSMSDFESSQRISRPMWAVAVLARRRDPRRMHRAGT